MADRERELEVGFLCESCLEPLDDRRPIDIDWRVPVGTKKRLCPKCEKTERLTVEVIDKVTTLFDRFRAEGLGPRQKLRRARDER